MEHGEKTKHLNLTYKVLPQIEGWQGDKTEITGVRRQWYIGQRLHTNRHNFTIAMGLVWSMLEWNSCVAIALSQLLWHRSLAWLQVLPTLESFKSGNIFVTLHLHLCRPNQTHCRPCLVYFSILLR